VEFEWNQAKAASNAEKHGVPFEYAVRVFLDPFRVDVQDLRRDYKEERRRVFGTIEEDLFLVVYTTRDTLIRIISARKANSRERRQYAGSLPS
jgi:uncharacterized DUF497 family protein